MKIFKTTKNPSTMQRGFALLLTLVAVSVILAIGLSLLQITLKQLTLSSIARDSEIAITAASTGIECIRYYRDQPGQLANLLAGGPAPSWNCGASTVPVESNTNHAALQHVYNYTFQHEAGDEMCVETSLYLLDTESKGSDITDYAVDEGLAALTCGSGLVCTTIFSRGFNRPCGELNSNFTVQRELTIQY